VTAGFSKAVRLESPWKESAKRKLALKTKDSMLLEVLDATADSILSVVKDGKMVSPTH
jgi:hypothetical protein